MTFPPAHISNRLTAFGSRGFTLVELLIAVLLLAVLLTLAAPAFMSFVTNTRLTSQANELVADLMLTRGEAAARSTSVMLCKAASSTTCATSGTDWSSGRIIWADTNGNSTLDSTEVIKYTQELTGDVVLTASSSQITFLPYGNTSGTASWTFTFCPPNSQTGRQVKVPLTGRATATKIETCS